MAIMVSENDLGGICKKRDALDEFKSDLNVLLHDGPLICSQRPRFKKNAVGYSELSDIVQIGSPGKTSQLFVRPSHCSGNFERVAANTLRVACGFAIAEIDRRA